MLVFSSRSDWLVKNFHRLHLPVFIPTQSLGGEVGASDKLIDKKLVFQVRFKEIVFLDCICLYKAIYMYSFVLFPRIQRLLARDFFAYLGSSKRTQRPAPGCTNSFVE